MYSQQGIQRTLVVEQLFSGIIYPVKCLVLVKQIDLVVFESFTYEYQKQRQDSFSLSIRSILIDSGRKTLKRHN